MSTATYDEMSSSFRSQGELFAGVGSVVCIGTLLWIQDTVRKKRQSDRVIAAFRESTARAAALGAQTPASDGSRSRSDVDIGSL